ncbi:CubicO group peptidase (beta-lactamase class C family) [Flavobacterium sp. 2755]|uniref:serine hydrolase domain-containing protein n=1 Tax=Flavobacterium sp. 2755 TaxID=2817765 RepID=UPI002864756D|nr:serine hydrolase [Flavobacterium sp. 2755]MDR6763673.1 CubicO group peptidase (beta-lactamase class C family) [Flavobacterium sp. 2755]
MKQFTLILLILLFTAAHGQKTVENKLDDISTAVNKGLYPNVEGLVITKNGKPIYEKYFHGFKKDSLHDSRSAFKSVAGLLAGIAIDKGFIKNVNEKVYSFFPEYKPYGNWNVLKDSMTVENLLEMKSGFDCEEWNGDKDCEDEMQNTQDWIKFCLDLPLKNKPGSQWDYTSINAMLLGGIIAHSSKMTVSDFADKYLFKPLGITSYKWTKDPLGHETAAGSFYISTNDMNKIGQLVLNDGVFNGKRIVSKKWIKAMTEKRHKIENFSNVGISKNKIAIPQPAYYGYTWYNEEVKTENFKYNIVFASGNGGQYIMVVKDLNLVVSFTGKSYNSSKSKLPFDILTSYVLPYFDKQ